MGSGMTGFLGGFLKAKQSFDELDQRKMQQQQHLEMQKEELKLRQQQLKGQEAHTILQNRKLETDLAQMLKAQQGREEFAALVAQGGNQDDPAIRQNILGIVARTAGPEAWVKMQEHFRAKDEMGLMNQLGTAPPMPGGVAVPPAAGAPPPSPVATSGLSPAFLAKAQQVASRLGMQPDDLLKIMHFETGGTFNPAEPNKAGSGATGLIQFMPDTARGLGTTTEALAQMTAEQQLDYVEKHLAPYKGKLGNLKDAYLAVLNPSAIGKPPETILWKNGTQAYAQNIGLDKDDKGYITVGDAVNAVQGGGARQGTAVTPSGVFDATQADLTQAMQERAQLTELQARYTSLQGRITSGPMRQELDRRIDNTRQALSSLNTRIDQARRFLEPSSETALLLRKHKGDVTAALDEQQEREVKRKEQEGFAGAKIAAEKAEQTELGKGKGEAEARAVLPLAQADREHQTNYLDQATGATIPGVTPYGEVQAKMGKGITYLNTHQLNRYDDIQSVIPVFNQLRDDLEKVYGPGGIFANLTPGQRLRAAGKGGLARLFQSDPALTSLARNITTNTELIARSVRGVRGAGTEQDVERSRQGIAQVNGIPDSQEVAYGLFNNLISATNKSLGFLLKNKQFQHEELKPLAPKAGVDQIKQDLLKEYGG